MAEQNTNPSPEPTPTPETPSPSPTPKDTPSDKPSEIRDPNVDALVKAEVDKALAAFKEKLDKAYGARDEAMKKLAEHEASVKAAEVKRLEAEGKKAEALELQLAEAKAKLSVLEESNTKLSRDNTVREHLSGLQFRNDKALSIALNMVTEQLTKNDKGQWVHTSGISISDFITAFAKDEDNAFLFKPKQSSGSGNTTVGDGKTSPGNKSLFSMSQAEVLDMIRKKHNL